MEHIVDKFQCVWLDFKSTRNSKGKAKLTAIIFGRGET